MHNEIKDLKSQHRNENYKIYEIEIPALKIVTNM